MAVRKGRRALPTEIYARFSDVDQAEAAIRALRHHCDGIHAFQIRRRPRPAAEGSDILPTAAFALYGSGAFTENGMGMGGITAPVAAAFWEEDSINCLSQGGMDGPAGREDCLLAVTIEANSVPQAEMILRGQHGLEIFHTGS